MHGQFIFDKNAKTIQCGEEQTMQQMELEQQDINMEKSEFAFLSDTTYRTQLKTGQRKYELKHLEENAGLNHGDISFGNCFLTMIPKAQMTSENSYIRHYQH